MSRRAAQTIVHDTTIATADAEGSVLHDAAPVVEGDRIAALGPSAALLARDPAAERVDRRGRLVLPGFASTHTHLPLTWSTSAGRTSRPPCAPSPASSTRDRRATCPT